MKHSKYYYDYTRNSLTEKDESIPHYYIGTNGYEARKVIEGFQPENYNISTAITYLLRAGKKNYKGSIKESMIEDIKKAIDHLTFELERHGRE
jgi:hypothetical protein